MAMLETMVLGANGDADNRAAALLSRGSKLCTGAISRVAETVEAALGGITRLLCAFTYVETRQLPGTPLYTALRCSCDISAWVILFPSVCVLIVQHCVHDLPGLRLSLV